MTHAALWRALLAAALLLAPHWAAADVQVPALKSRVTDLTGTLTPDQRAALEAKLATFETSKGSQVAVLIVPSTQPEAIEQYSIRVVEQWKLGRKGVDDGALLIVAKNDRKLRIEVGRGLEGAIPDAIARRIVSDIIAPRFREGDFYGGITAGVDRILRTIEGEPLPPPPRTAPRGQDGNGLETLFVLGFILVVFVGGFLRAVFGRFLGAGVVGVAGGVLGYVLVGAIGAVLVAVAVFLLSLLLGMAPRTGSGWGGGWSSGGGSWGSSGGSGGGFSGGGGDFGGGGASGSW